MASPFKLEIVTPHKIAYKREVEMVTTRTTEGDMGILAGHAPIVTELVIGEMRIKRSGMEERYFIGGGFLEVSEERVLVLADKAIPVDEIDIVKAQEEKELYEAKLRKLSEDREIAVTQRALQETLAKIRMKQGM